MTSKRKSPASAGCREMNRRGFLTAGIVATAACFFPSRAVAAVSNVFSAERSLSFYNIHTGESLKAVYWDKDRYVFQSLADINSILRDYRTGEVKQIDTGLLDLLFALHQKLGSRGSFHVISGYRSPTTNALLNMISRGVVKNSLHIEGKAIDISLPGYELKTLHRAAIDLQRGGVGYYPSSDFVHVDVGRVRCW